MNINHVLDKRQHIDSNTIFLKHNNTQYTTFTLTLSIKFVLCVVLLCNTINFVLISLERYSF